jgi:hypothetical protein
MASKQKLFIKSKQTKVDAYQHDENLGLFLDDDGLWKAVHIRTGQLICGPSGTFKKKRSCLAFIESINALDWTADDEEEMYLRNGGFEAMKERYFAAVEKAREVA